MSISSHWPAPRGGMRLSSHKFPAIITALLVDAVACSVLFSLVSYPYGGATSSFGTT